MFALTLMTYAGAALGLVAVIFVVAFRREQRKLRAEILAQIDREPEKIQTVFYAVGRDMQSRVAVKFRGEGRMNIPEMTGVEAAELYRKISMLAPNVERVEEPATTAGLPYRVPPTFRK